LIIFDINLLKNDILLKSKMIFFLFQRHGDNATLLP
jgi:hypothetical protein